MVTVFGTTGCGSTTTVVDVGTTGGGVTVFSGITTGVGVSTITGGVTTGAGGTGLMEERKAFPATTAATPAATTATTTTLRHLHPHTSQRHYLIGVCQILLILIHGIDKPHLHVYPAIIQCRVTIGNWHPLMLRKIPEEVAVSVR